MFAQDVSTPNLFDFVVRLEDKAKKTPLHSYEYYEDLQEYFGFCEGDFC